MAYRRRYRRSSTPYRGQNKRWQVEEEERTRRRKILHEVQLRRPDIRLKAADLTYCIIVSLIGAAICIGVLWLIAHSGWRGPRTYWSRRDIINPELTGGVLILIAAAALVAGPAIIAGLDRFWFLGNMIVSIVGLWGLLRGQSLGYVTYSLVLWFSFSVAMTRARQNFVEKEWDSQELRRLGFDPEVVRSDPLVNSRPISPKATTDDSEGGADKPS